MKQDVSGPILYTAKKEFKLYLPKKRRMRLVSFYFCKPEQLQLNGGMPVVFCPHFAIASNPLCYIDNYVS